MGSASGGEARMGHQFYATRRRHLCDVATYNADGTPLWLSGTANNTSPGVDAGTLYLTTGPPFNAVPFDPNLVQRTVARTATLSFANGNSGTFSYSVNTQTGVVTQMKSITRQVFRSPGTVCQ